MSTLRRMATLTALALALGACAGTPEGEGAPEEPAVEIRVVNGFRPTTALTVHFLDGGERDLLGTVVPAGERTFRYHPADMAATSARLLAETGTGREITSPSFTLRPDAEIVWDVEANTVEPR